VSGYRDTSPHASHGEFDQIDQERTPQGQIAMKYRRPIDETATKAARERQEDSEFGLQLLFGLPYEITRARKFNLSMHHSLTEARSGLCALEDESELS